MSAVPFDFETIRKLTTQSIPFAQRAGIDLVEFERGYVKMKMPLEGNQNHVGTMYAGALFTTGEIPGGALFMSAFDSSKYYPIVVEMNIKFLKPAKTDVTVEARISEDEIARVNQELEDKGKSIFILEKEIRDLSGELVASTKGVYQGRAFQMPPKS